MDDVMNLTKRIERILNHFVNHLLFFVRNLTKRIERQNKAYAYQLQSLDRISQRELKGMITVSPTSALPPIGISQRELKVVKQSA